MTVFDVFMVVLGLIIIAISFFFTEKSNGQKEDGLDHNSGNRLDESSLLALKNKVEESLTTLSEQTIVKTENGLNKVTNEKIMAISDYSDQILEKIDQNHTEVVFLYNMLNEKEETMKEQYGKEVVAKNSLTKETTEYSKPNTSDENKNKQDKKQPKRDIQGINDEEAAMLINPTAYTYKEQEFTEEDKQNNNQAIMKLYAEGKSITEIAKTLDLGKGEVKFVVNLYERNK
ncbi:DUF6115 domain-containing protein [Anaerosporobacter faecicola]|uniref:DUF6115 domain-containing protein n=1 Tax=Anaerosporobacter faecicola TaxID=2718714 RepID=UPI00143905BD|nr:DUF6115 domain-containing protein [Anaerosporobacter faecicola]